MYTTTTTQNTAAAHVENLSEELALFLSYPRFEVRAAAVFALGCLIQAYELPPPPVAGQGTTVPGDGSPSSTHSAESMPPCPPMAVLPAATRTALERAIACHVLNVCGGV